MSRTGVLEYAIPGARRVVVRNAGHLLYMEQPDRFVELLSGFVRGKAP